MSKATLSDDIQEASKRLKKTIALDVKIEEHSDANMSEQSESSWSSEHLSDSDAGHGQEYGMQDNNAAAVKLILANLRSIFLSHSMGKAGSKSKDEQIILDCLATAVMSKEIVSARLQSAVTRIIGITRQQQTRGLNLLRENARKGKLHLCIPRQAHSYGKKANKDLDFVYRWFHEDSDLVEIDKSRRNAYKGRSKEMLVTVAGKKRRLTCQRRIMNATKTQLAQSFLESVAYADWTKSHPGLVLPLKTVQACICPCMKPATLTECACPTCVEFRCLIKAWREQRKKWHTVPCTCAGCTGPKFSAYMKASASTSEFLDTLLCPRQPYAHLAFPYTDETPSFFALSCCMKSPRCPTHCTPCSCCGWDHKFYRFYDCVERTDDTATWMKWQITELRNKNDTRPVLRDYVGTREELTDSIRSKCREFAYHRWVNDMASHQEKLDVQTFDGAEEIVMKTDFAAGGWSS
jgi:hypothetical protein